MRNIIIINWRFDNFALQEKNVNDKKLVKLYNSCLSNMPSQNIEKEIIDFIKSNSNDNILLLLHSSEPHFYTSEKVGDLKLKINNDKICIELFGGGLSNNHPVYCGRENKGLLGDGELADKAIENDKIKEDYFDNVWDHYYTPVSERIESKLKDFSAL